MIETKFQVGDILQFHDGYYYIHTIDYTNKEYKLTNIGTGKNDYFCNIRACHTIAYLITDAFRQHE